MATKSDIDTDLALELEGNKDSKKFLEAVTAFIKYVEEMAKISAGDEACLDWTVQVKKANNLICMKPVPGYNPAIAEKTYAVVGKGINSINDGVLPDDHSKEALSYLRRIGEVADGENAPRLWIKKEPVQITQKVSANIKDYINKHYQDYGSIEGLLQVISERGSYSAEITDPLIKKPVKCILNKGLVKDALDVFGRRVEAHGKIKYRADGAVLSIEVEKITPFPSPEEIPSFEDVRGILKD